MALAEQPLGLTESLSRSKVARWQNFIPSFPSIAPGWRAWGGGSNSRKAKGSNFAAKRSGAMVLQSRRAKRIKSINVTIAIWQPCLGEEALIDGHVGAGDGAVERQGDHLRGLLDGGVGGARDHGAVGRAEAVGKGAVGQVASGGPVGTVEKAYFVLL